MSFITSLRFTLQLLNSHYFPLSGISSSLIPQTSSSSSQHTFHFSLFRKSSRNFIFFISLLPFLASLSFHHSSMENPSPSKGSKRKAVSFAEGSGSKQPRVEDLPYLTENLEDPAPSFAQRKGFLKNCLYVDVQTLNTLGYDVLEYFRDYMPFLEINNDYNMEVVRAFYSSLEHSVSYSKREKGIVKHVRFTATLRKRRITFDWKEINRLLGIDTEKYNKWVRYIQYNKEGLAEAYDGAARPAQMSDKKRVMHYIYSRMMVHKGGNYSEFTTLDNPWLPRILNKEPINIGQLISMELLRYMNEKASKTNSTLPYPSFIAFLLEKHMIKSTLDSGNVECHPINKSNLKKMGISYNEPEGAEPSGAHASTSQAASGSVAAEAGGQPEVQSKGKGKGPAKVAIGEELVDQIVFRVTGEMGYLLDIQDHKIEGLDNKIEGLNTQVQRIEDKLDWLINWFTTPDPPSDHTPFPSPPHDPPHGPSPGPSNFPPFPPQDPQDPQPSQQQPSPTPDQSPTSSHHSPIIDPLDTDMVNDPETNIPDIPSTPQTEPQTAIIPLPTPPAPLMMTKGGEKPKLKPISIAKPLLLLKPSTLFPQHPHSFLPKQWLSQNEVIELVKKGSGMQFDKTAYEAAIRAEAERAHAEYEQAQAEAAKKQAEEALAQAEAAKKKAEEDARLEALKFMKSQEPQLYRVDPHPMDSKTGKFTVEDFVSLLTQKYNLGEEIQKARQERPVQPTPVAVVPPQPTQQDPKPAAATSSAKPLPKGWRYKTIAKKKVKPVITPPIITVEEPVEEPAENQMSEEVTPPETPASSALPVTSSGPSPSTIASAIRDEIESTVPPFSVVSVEVADMTQAELKHFGSINITPQQAFVLDAMRAYDKAPKGKGWKGKGKKKVTEEEETIPWHFKVGGFLLGNGNFLVAPPERTRNWEFMSMMGNEDLTREYVRMCLEVQIEQSAPSSSQPEMNPDYTRLFANDETFDRIMKESEREEQEREERETQEAIELVKALELKEKERQESEMWAKATEEYLKNQKP